ncbi:MAG: hypothetical protein WCD79_07350 [Chthoniobacteraceae bacterium]
MRILFVILLLLVSWSRAFAAPAVTVLNALKLLPKDQVKNLVRIEAREGDPLPECWYIQVYDPQSENGLREYVVSGKGITATRNLSQFLSGAKPEDVVGSRMVKVDSDDLLKITQQYVEANHLTVAKINYTMLREAINPAPVWKLACFDESGKKLAEVVINARNANVVSHDGFVNVPSATEVKPPASSQGQTGVKPATAVRPATAVAKGSPPPAASSSPQKRAPLFQRMFGGKKDQPTPVPAH